MKKFALLVLLFAFSIHASILGLDALGEHHNAGGMASAAGRGFAGSAKTGDAEGISLSNPARLAFDTKVAFNVNFLIEMLQASYAEDSYGVNTISIPSFNLSFPMGAFGALGLSLWQSYASILREEVNDTTLNAFAKLEYQSSVYEIVPTYAIRVPYLRNFSLGVSAHLIMGSARRSLTLGPDNSAIKEEDAWATTQANLTDYVEGSWEIKNHPAYYTVALQYRGRSASYYFSATTPHTLQNKLEYNFRFSEIDTLAPTKYTREIEVPLLLATGINYRFLKRHNIMADLEWRAWDADVENIAGSFDMEDITETGNDILAAIGYQRDGSTLFYDPYYERITYRGGAWYKKWYIKEVHEVGASLGAGFPLGRKGTVVDIALQGGRRFVDEGDRWEETFISIRLGLMGISSWGKTR